MGGTTLIIKIIDVPNAITLVALGDRFLFNYKKGRDCLWLKLLLCHQMEVKKIDRDSKEGLQALRKLSALMLKVALKARI